MDSDPDTSPTQPVRPAALPEDSVVIEYSIHNDYDLVEERHYYFCIIDDEGNYVLSTMSRPVTSEKPV